MIHIIQTYRKSLYKIEKIVGHMTSFRTPMRFSFFEQEFISVLISPNVTISPNLPKSPKVFGKKLSAILPTLYSMCTDSTNNPSQSNTNATPHNIAIQLSDITRHCVGVRLRWIMT